MGGANTRSHPGSYPTRNVQFGDELLGAVRRERGGGARRTRPGPPAAESTLDGMSRPEGVWPDTITYGTAIVAWSAVGDPRRAKRFLERQLRDNGSGSSVVDAVVLFGAAIDAWGKSGEVDRGVRAEALLDRLVEMVGSEGGGGGGGDGVVTVPRWRQRYEALPITTTIETLPSTTILLQLFHPP